MNRLRRIFSEGWLDTIISNLTRGYYPAVEEEPILTGVGTVHGPRDTHITYGPAGVAMVHGPKNTGEVNG